MADLSLAKFRANVTDVARPNRFWITMDISNDINNYGNDNQAQLTNWDNRFEFLVKTASLPGRTVGNIELNWQGMKYNIAGDPTFEDITFTFVNNYEFDLRAYFEHWLEVIAQMGTNERSQPGSYKSDVITLQQLGRTQADILATYTLEGAYPTSVANVDLSMESNDQAQEVSVTMKYDYFQVRYGS